jgi:hypothetical protein
MHEGGSYDGIGDDERAIYFSPISLSAEVPRPYYVARFGLMRKRGAVDKGISIVMCIGGFCIECRME